MGKKPKVKRMPLPQPATFPDTLGKPFAISYYGAEICVCNFEQLMDVTVVNDGFSLAGPDSGKYLVSRTTVEKEGVLLAPFVYDIRDDSPQQNLFRPHTTWAPQLNNYCVSMYKVDPQDPEKVTKEVTAILNPWRAEGLAPFKYANHLPDNNCELVQYTHKFWEGGCGGERIWIVNRRPIDADEELGVSYGGDDFVKQFLEPEINFKFQYDALKTHQDKNGHNVMYGTFKNMMGKPMPAGRMIVDFEVHHWKMGQVKQDVSIQYRKKVVKKTKPKRKVAGMSMSKVMEIIDSVPHTPPPPTETPPSTPLSPTLFTVPDDEDQ